jgi:hypothetical protein
MSTCTLCHRTIPEGATSFAVTVSEEVFVHDAVEVRDSRLVWQFCESCGRTRDFDALAMPPPAAPRAPRDAADALAVELGDAYVSAFGKPVGVWHSDDDAHPHVDVFIYAPGRVLEGWTLVTAGRSLVPIAGARLELVQHLRPAPPLADVEEAAEVLRRVALTFEQGAAPWSYRPLAEASFAALRRDLRLAPLFMLALYRAPSPG